MRQLHRVLVITLFLLLAFSAPRRTEAYGLATHQLIVDLLWDHSILPLLCDAFPPPPPPPNKANKQVECTYEQARRFAYSGAVLQDSGYYYYRGSKADTEAIEHFSDMTHYARSGDFVTNLFKSATDVNELAFALGALTHYVGDIEGHSLATNQSVPITFPNHFPGYSVVTYEQQPDDHLQVEFGFDVNAAKLMRLRPPSQMKRQKADLSLQQLTFAYYRTYGMHKDFTRTGDGFSSRSFYASSNFILPSGTYLRARVEKRCPAQESDKVGLEAMIERVAKEEHWKRERHYTWMPRPVAAMLLHLSAKSTEKMPVSDTQVKYAASVVVTVNKLAAMIAAIDRKGPFMPVWLADGATNAVGPLPNVNLDTGESEVPGKYSLSDRIHQVWLVELAKTPADYPNWPLPPSVQSSVSKYFGTVLPSWDKTKISENLKLMNALPAWPTDEPCPDNPKSEKKFGGGQVTHVDKIDTLTPSRKSLCSYLEVHDGSTVDFIRK